MKFLDPGSMFTCVKETILNAIGVQKVNYAAFSKHPVRNSAHSRWQWQAMSSIAQENGVFVSQGYMSPTQIPTSNITGMFSTGDMWVAIPTRMKANVGTDTTMLDDRLVTIIGQAWDTFIIAENEEYLYYIDQHAVAERIAFEKMKKTIKEKWFISEMILQPFIIEYPKSCDIEEIIQALQSIWFDISTFPEEKVIIHAIPKVFAEYKIDIELVLNSIWAAENISQKKGSELFGLIIDEVVGMKACKASIKAWQKLSFTEMKQLLDDAREYIPGMFVCQHGRPSVVAIPKPKIEELFERH